MRKPLYNISEYDFVYCVAGELYRLAPNRHPRNAELIMNKVVESFRKNGVCSNEYYSVSVADPKNSYLNY